MRAIAPIIPIKINGFTTYNGGKSGSGTYQTIINQIPPHDIFVSLFAGNCGVTRYKKPSSHTIIVDLDPGVTQNWLMSDLPSGFSVVKGNATDYLSLLRCLPASQLADCVIYADPPYRYCTRRSTRDLYRYEMSDSDHEAMLAAIADFPVKILLSHYPDDLYDEVLGAHRWRCIDYQAMTRQGVRTERLYMNFPYTPVLHDYSYIGRDFRQRELYKKLKTNFLRKLSGLPAELRNSIIADLPSHINAMPDYIA
jgi:hypothetical protein